MEKKDRGSEVVQACGEFVFTARNADGTVAWQERFANAPTTAGLNAMLSVTFAGGSQTGTWYFGLVNNSGFSAFAASDTMSSHSGWTELTDYSESVRQEWAEGTPASGILGTTTVATFTINATVTIKGAFVTSSSTKSGTSGTLWATGAFSSNQSLTSGQTLQVTYQLTLTGS